MLIELNKQEVIKGGLQGERSFTISHNSPKAFQILSDGLYSDKPLAIVRELSCNAWDSHVAAGKNNQPIIIHAPNTIEPWFSVKDFGVGLDHSQVLEIYTTYFASTKTDSNDFIGALGLGSKSPFSYTKSFTVTAIKNGSKRIYTAFINEDEIPTIALMTDEPTTESSGVEVRVPIKEHDFMTFEYKIREITKYFNPAPIVEGIPNFSPTPPTYLMSGTNWKLRSSRNNSYANAIMGNVCYPINTNKFSDLSHAQKCALNSSFDIHFDIGELEVAASREALSYKPHTQDMIKKKVDAIIEEFNLVINEKFKDCKTEFEARKLYAKLLSEYSYRSMINSNLYNVVWNGLPIKSSMFDLGKLTAKDKNGVSRYKEKMEFTNFRNGYSHTLKQSYNGEINIDTLHTIHFIRNDVPNQTGKTRITEYSRNRNDTYILVSLCDEDIDTFEKDLGIKFLLVSDLPKVTKPKSTPKILVYSPSDIRETPWYESKVSPTDQKGLYVEMNAWSVIHNGENVTTRLRDVVNAMEDCGMPIRKQVLVGLRKTVISEFLEEKQNWTNFWDYMEKEITQFFSNPGVHDSVYDHAQYNAFSKRGQVYTCFVPYVFDNKWHQLPEYRDHKLAKFIKKIHEVHNNGSSKSSAIIKLAELTGRKLQIPNNAFDYNKSWDELTRDNPMLNVMIKSAGHLSRSDLETVLAYVK